MRLTCILLVAAATLVGVLDVSAAATGNTVVANPAMVSSAFAPVSQGRRSLRLVKDDDVDDDEKDESTDEEGESADEVDEERMWGGFAKAKQALEDNLALTAVASNFIGKSADDMGEVLKKLSKKQISTIFDKGEDSIKGILPGFHTGMSFDKFDDLIKGLPLEQQAVMASAYTKYLDNKGLLSKVM